jgi:uncharacterized protein (TIGR04255 family)
MARRLYKNPPIEEAVCEFHFVPDPNQDFSAPARFYDGIKDDYSGKQEVLLPQPNEIQIQGNQNSLRIGFQSQPARLLFPDAARKHLVGLGGNLLSIHVLRPYKKWEDFRGRIEKALNAYIQAAKPVGITKTELRYINKIEIRDEAFTISDYLTTGVVLPSQMGMNIGNLFTRVESAFPGTSVRLHVMLARVDAETPEGRLLLLDLEVKQEWPTDHTLPVSEAMTVIEDLRSREREAFEAFITDKARAQFDAG